MAVQSMDTTKVQHGGPVGFLGVTYRSMGRWLLTGAEVTPRQLHPQMKWGLHAFASRLNFIKMATPLHPSWVRVHRSQKPGVHCSARAAHRLDNVFPRDSVLSRYQAVYLVFVSLSICLVSESAAWLFRESSSKLGLAHLREALSIYCFLCQGGA